MSSRYSAYLVTPMCAHVGSVGPSTQAAKKVLNLHLMLQFVPSKCYDYTLIVLWLHFKTSHTLDFTHREGFEGV